MYECRTTLYNVESRTTSSTFVQGTNPVTDERINTGWRRYIPFEEGNADTSSPFQGRSLFTETVTNLKQHQIEYVNMTLLSVLLTLHDVVRRCT